MENWVFLLLFTAQWIFPSADDNVSCLPSIVTNLKERYGHPPLLTPYETVRAVLLPPPSDFAVFAMIFGDAFAVLDVGFGVDLVPLFKGMTNEELCKQKDENNLMIMNEDTLLLTFTF